VQESLTNVVRHAGAKRACVTVDYQSGRVSLSVIDDGAGGPIGPGGSGLASMAARTHALGGSIQAGPGRTGFEVKAVLPYRNVDA
jgi:signal transduction histidine kinase